MVDLIALGAGICRAVEAATATRLEVVHADTTDPVRVPGAAEVLPAWDLGVEEGLAVVEVGLAAVVAAVEDRTVALRR